MKPTGARGGLRITHSARYRAATRRDPYGQAVKRGNWFHDLGTAIRIPGSRCHWRGCDERNWSGGAYDIRENLFDDCGSGVSIEDRPDYYVTLGFDSDHNIFDADTAVYNQANWSGLEQAFTLGEYRAEYDGEESSSSAPPDLDTLYRPAVGSPARDAGDPSVYEGGAAVNIGLWPFLE